MQCPSCRFENMPGLASCGRCGSSLTLNAVAIDVNPPRASRTAKRIRRWFPRRGYYRARDIAAETLRRADGTFVDDLRVPLPEPEVAARLLVPGWAHIHTGQAERGFVFLGLYVLLIGLGLINWGNTLGSIFCGLAVSTHISAVLDLLLRQGSVRFPSLLTTSFLVSLAVVLGIYAPAGWVLSGVAATRTYDYDAPPFARFDTLLYNHWAFALRPPRPGDVVLFDSPNQPTVRAGQALHVRFVIRENECVDRILGGPGDHVAWDDGRLSINGAAVAWKPLIPSKLPKHLEIDVPAGMYLALPTTSLGVDKGTPEEAWTYFGCHPVGAIRGRVYLRLHPLSRLWFLH